MSKNKTRKRQLKKYEYQFTYRCCGCGRGIYKTQDWFSCEYAGHDESWHTYCAEK